MSVLYAGQAFAVSVSEGPATFTGAATCGSKYPGSFLDIGRGECWQCPPSHPHRTIFPVTGGAACERGAHERFRRATGPRDSTGILRTDCPEGWFLDIWTGKCYSCEGYRRTAFPVTHERACAQLVGPSWTSATLKGQPGCPPGSFRHGLTDKCFACPDGYIRNAVIADDLSKVNACTRVSLVDQAETHEKFHENKDKHPASRQNLANALAAVQESPDDPVDKVRRDLMRSTLEDELNRDSGFDTVTWLVAGGGAIGVGYTHAAGYAISKVDGRPECRKVWSNAFTAGLSAGAGGVDVISLSKGGLGAVAGESNGWQVGASFVFSAGAFGLHWDATSGEMIISAAAGSATGSIDLNLSEYVHTWTETGNDVRCEDMTWGTGWGDL